MATAKRVRAQPVEPPPDAIRLELTEREASVLRTLIWDSVNGETSGPRGHLSEIEAALDKAGVRLAHNVRTSGIVTVCSA